MIKLKSILIITPFLNKTSPANFRITSFISEFEKKYTLHIINTSYEKKENRTTYYKINEDYSKNLDKKSNIRSNPIFRSFFLPFFYLNWIIDCFIVGSNIIENKRINYIFVSHGPPNVLFVGFLLKLRHNNCKLITDYRDSWTDNPYRIYPSRLLRKLLENIEYQILTQASLIVVVSIVEKMRFKKYKNIINKIVIVRNGFFITNIKINKKGDYYKITHAGSFLKIKQPDIILKAYKEFLKKDREINSKLYLIGNLDKTNIAKIQKNNLDKNTILTGSLQYVEALKKIYNSDLLVFYEPTDAITTKIYDYLSSGVPILTITNNKEAIKFIEKYSPYSTIIERNDINLIADKIYQNYINWKNKEHHIFRLRKKFYKKYNRKRLAEKLVRKIEKI